MLSVWLTAFETDCTKWQSSGLLRAPPMLAYTNTLVSNGGRIWLISNMYWFRFSTEAANFLTKFSHWLVKSDQTISMIVYPQSSRYFPGFQESSAKEMRTAFFWVIMQRVVVVPCRSFGTTYRSHWSYTASSGNSLQTFRDNLYVPLTLRSE